MTGLLIPILISKVVNTKTGAYDLGFGLDRD